MSISLDQVKVAIPCAARWDQMTGTKTHRFCQHCQKTVHDLSAMPLADAERLLCQSAGSLCIRYVKGIDGQVQTLDYRARTGGRTFSWKAWTLLALAGALVAGVVNAAFFGGRVMPATRVMGHASQVIYHRADQPVFLSDNRCRTRVAACPPASAINKRFRQPYLHPLLQLLNDAD